MQLTRRNFLTAAPLALGLLKLGGSAMAQAGNVGGLFAIPARTDRISQLDWNAFLPYQNTDFTFSNGDNAFRLSLSAMKDSAPGGFIGKGSHPCFELHFEANFITPIEQGTYRVEHFGLGTFDLFITPGGQQRHARNLNRNY